MNKSEVIRTLINEKNDIKDLAEKMIDDKLDEILDLKCETNKQAKNIKNQLINLRYNHFMLWIISSSRKEKFDKLLLNTIFAKGVLK